MTRKKKRFESYHGSCVWMILFVYICTDRFMGLQLFFWVDVHWFVRSDLRDSFHILS